MNVYLIGPRGSGKSTVARLVARHFQLPLFSTDEWIRGESSRTIVEIFAQSGEEAFRDWESRALSVAATFPAAVVDLGGGAILRAENRELIRRSGSVVWLLADPQQLWERVSADPQSASARPALTDSPGIEEMRRIVADRESLYAACADYEIDTTLLSPDEVARRIVARFPLVDKRNRGTADRP